MSKKNGGRSAFQRAHAFAAKAHAGQKRTSGEPFITHLVAVAELLKSIGADEETLVAALLHDSLEDTPVTAKQLRREFGMTVTGLVEGVTKVEQLEKTFDKKVRNLESIRKMFRAMGHDIRVLFIKLADRLHNMRTIDAVPPEKQVRIARETQDIYCPLANLLGIREWYEELSDHCFRILDPVEYEFMRRKYTQTWKEQHRGLDQWIARMRSFLQQHGIKGSQVELQKRHAREVRIQSVEQESLLHHAESFHAALITLPDNTSPYDALESVHQFASPLPGGIDDYIASPKVNGYQAIHTSVLSSSGNLITVIIQTKEMRKHATLGMAEFFPRFGKHRQSIPDWAEALLTLDKDEQDLQAFFRHVRSEIFSERDRVQIVAGRTRKAIDLPSYASVLDLAFYAGEEIGARTTAATINGKPASLKQLVHEGDTVEFFLEKGHVQRDAQDLYMIHTALAHKHLVSHLASLPRRDRIARGRKLLQHAFTFTIDPFFSIRWQKEIRERINPSDDVLAQIGSGMTDAFIYVEERGRPEEFFLLDPDCLQLPAGLMPGQLTRYVLRTPIEDLRNGDIVGIQAGPDVIDVVERLNVRLSQQDVHSREIVPLQVRTESAKLPFHFALRWTFLPDSNVLRDINALESFLDTPVRLVQFEPTSVTLEFRTDRLRTLQIGYKYLYNQPHILKLFRTTP